MIDDHIKFRHLQCFLAVVDHSTLQKAAIALSVSLPAVSKTIKELEDILKIRLFDRSRNGVQMTLQAEIFSIYAEAAVQALQQAANFMGPVQNSTNPMIKIGATPAMASSFTAQALMAFRQRVSHIQVSVVTGTTSHLMEQLREREFDLVLCRHLEPERMAGLSFEYLFADPLVAVVRTGHPLSRPAHDDNNGHHQFLAIFPAKSSINRRAAVALSTALGIDTITDFIECPSIAFGRTYTINSDAIWFVPWSAAKLEVERGELVKLSRSSKGGDESLGLMASASGLVMRLNSVPSSETQILIGAIRECALERRAEIF